MKPDWIEKEFGYVRKHVEQHWGRCILLVIGSLTLLTLSPPAYWGLVALIVAVAWAVWRFLLMMTDSETPLDSPSVTLIRSEPPLRHLGRDYVEPIPLCSQGLAPFLNCDAPLRFFLTRQHASIGCWELQTPTKTLEFDTPSKPCRLLVRARANDVARDRWFLMEPDEKRGLKFSALPENQA
jgi:hypothetical protein